MFSKANTYCKQDYLFKQLSCQKTTKLVNVNEERRWEIVVIAISKAFLMYWSQYHIVQIYSKFVGNISSANTKHNPQ